MTKHHIIISGTGRAGTTFLVQLFTALEFNTGFTDTTSAVCLNCNAGMEWDLQHPDAPYIIKNPWLCDYLDDLLRDKNVIIDHVIIPIRDLYPAAESRRHVTRRTNPELLENVQGGLWDVEDPSQQEAVLTNKLYRLIYTVAKRNLPVTFLYFPRLVYEPEYLYNKLGFIMNEITYEGFFEAFTLVANPELIHDFKKADADYQLFETDGLQDETKEN